MASKKKAAPKKGKAEKPTLKTAAKKAAPKMGERVTPKSAIDSLIRLVETQFGAGTIRRASASHTSHTLRRPTGIPDLDIDGLAGGWPAGAMCMVTGPDGAGKDYLINCTIRELQRNYGDETRVCIYSTEFPYDKGFARNVCGVAVAYTDGELDEIDEIRAVRSLPPLTKEERAEMQTQIGEIILVQGVIADHGLDIVNEVLSSGAFQMIVINSLGVFETAAKDGTDSLEEHAAQSSEAQLLSRFIPKMFMHLNRPLGDGSRNETTILAANQVRANRDLPRMRPGIPMPAHMKYQPGSGSRALAHGKAIDLLVHKGADIIDKEMDPPVMIGREVPWVIYKGKLGTHDGIKGSYSFYFDGGADRGASLLSIATRYAVVEQSGAWYAFNADGRGTGPTMKAQGSDAAAMKLMADPVLFQAVYDATVKAAGVICRYT